mmetsp:Transcript_29775/g.77021  ORF Transcript_29775/g.77021 Transcript_29775/m.77021 type:complete len:292 (-) Transcript_29775:436-1311(-)
MRQHSHPWRHCDARGCKPGRRVHGGLRSPTPPRRPRWVHGEAGGSGALLLVHDDFAQGVELPGRLHWLGEEVGEIVDGADERHFELKGLDHVANVEVAPRHVLHPVVVLGVVRDVAGALRVGREGGRAAGGVAQALQQLARVDDVLCALRQRDDLGLASGQGDAVLLARAPRQRRGLPQHHPARRRVGRLPRGVREGAQSGGLAGVRQADGREAREVGEHVVDLAEELGRGALEAFAQAVDREREIGSCGGGSVHEAADTLLHVAEELGMRAGRQGQSVRNVFQEVGRVGE